MWVWLGVDQRSSRRASRAVARQHAHWKCIGLQPNTLGQLGRLRKPVLEARGFWHAPLLNRQRCPVRGGGCADVVGSQCGDKQPLRACFLPRLLRLLLSTFGAGAGRRCSLPGAAPRVRHWPLMLLQHASHCCFEAQRHAQATRGVIWQRCKVPSCAEPLLLQGFHCCRWERAPKVLTGQRNGCGYVGGWSDGQCCAIITRLQRACNGRRDAPT